MLEPLVTEPPAKPITDLKPVDPRAIAERIDKLKGTGMTSPGDRVGLYAEALRALAQERGGR